METGFHCLLDKSVERGKGEGSFFVVMGLKCGTTRPSVPLGTYGVEEERRDTGRQGESHSILALFFCFLCWVLLWLISRDIMRVGRAFSNRYHPFTCRNSDTHMS